MLSRFLSIVILSLILLSCSQPQLALQVAPEDKQLVELSDMFQTGHARFQEVIHEDSLIQAVWEARTDVVVMVLIDVEFEDGDKEQIQQSGILIGEKQLVLTAGHGFVVDEGKIVAIRIVAGENREVAVSLLDIRYNKLANPVQDWAILKPLYDLRMPTLPIPPSNSTFSKQVLVLGYPGSLGLNSEGLVERVDKNMIDPKAPLGIICERQRLDRFTLTPIAGSVPVRGISGAPIFNMDGELTGVFSSMGRRRLVDTWHYIFGMSEVPWDRIRELEGK